jgi:DNA-binding NarL/FixJ family response regulator
MYVVDDASTGEKAISLVGQVQPDVVIMDINLPSINGIEATQKIKDDYPNTKVIGISFLNDQELINNVLNAGASDFIGKDETLQSICQAIRDAVS